MTTHGIKRITAIYDKMQEEAERIVFEAIADYCRKNKLECITNGPFGMQVDKVYSRYREGAYKSHDGKWKKEYEPSKEIKDLVEWYTV